MSFIWVLLQTLVRQLRLSLVVQRTKIISTNLFFGLSAIFSASHHLVPLFVLQKAIQNFIFAGLENYYLRCPQTFAFNSFFWATLVSAPSLVSAQSLWLSCRWILEVPLARLAERLLAMPEICSSNPAISNFSSLSVHWMGKTNKRFWDGLLVIFAKQG